jgi:hypothetical protein
MDLTKEFPRSPNAMLAGIVSLPRVIDKARASAEGTLGEYKIDCPHDRPVLDLLGVDFATFAAKIKELDYDDAKIEAWAASLLAKRSPQALAEFNRARRNWKPNAQTQAHFDELHAQLAPDRPDVTTWFQLLDVEEKRAA